MKNFLIITASLMIIMYPNFLTAKETYVKDVKVKSFYGIYDTAQKSSGQPSPSLKQKDEIWHMGQYFPKKPITIQVIDPNMGDQYWSATNCALYKHALEINQNNPNGPLLKLDLWSAKTYLHLGDQMKKIKASINDSNIDGIILASINYTKNNEAVSQAKGKKPIIEYVNDIEAPTITAKSMVSFYDMGLAAGNFMKNHFKGSEKIQVLALPGPKNSGWADSSYDGLLKGVENSNIEVVDFNGFGDTKPGTQKIRLQVGLKKFKGVKVIWGNAVAASLAPEFLKESKIKGVQVIASYLTAPVFQKIAEGKILAAPADLNVYQAKIALDMMIRTLNGEKPGIDFGFRVSPEIPIIHKGNLKEMNSEDLLCEPDWQLRAKVN